jgi:tetratricopeptide (TPR) repeat protein
MIEAIEKDIGQFQKSGGKPLDADNPARKWAEVLWQYHEVHPGTPASAKVANLALRAFTYTGQVDNAIAKAQTFKPEDPAWEEVVGPLFWAAGEKKDYGSFIKTVESILKGATDKKTRAVLWLNLGQAYQEQKERERAKTAFRAAAREAPDSDYGKSAKGNLYELTSLNVGQVAPQFTAKTLDGRDISRADLNGNVVLLNFWASW